MGNPEIVTTNPIRVHGQAVVVKRKGSDNKPGLPLKILVPSASLIPRPSLVEVVHKTPAKAGQLAAPGAPYIRLSGVPQVRGLGHVLVPVVRRQSTSRSEAPTVNRKFASVVGGSMKRCGEDVIACVAGEKESDGLRDTAVRSAKLDRKSCNCERSNCLKLYCECFRTGHMCQKCSCRNCYNNVENDNKRVSAIKSALVRNKNAFKSRIKSVKEKATHQHRSGCHCSRSNCTKGYCECYQNRVFCGDSCRCVSCHNRGHKAPELRTTEVGASPASEPLLARLADHCNDRFFGGISSGVTPAEFSFNYITRERPLVSLSSCEAPYSEDRKTDPGDDLPPAEPPTSSTADGETLTPARPHRRTDVRPPPKHQPQLDPVVAGCKRPTPSRAEQNQESLILHSGNLLIDSGLRCSDTTLDDDVALDMLKEFSWCLGVISEARKK